MLAGGGGGRVVGGGGGGRGWQEKGVLRGEGRGGAGVAGEETHVCE